MENKGDIEHITALRGIAALLLVLYYLNSQVWSHGYLGIDIFLVITGYLLLSGRRAFPGNESMRDGFYFMVRRLHKIIPPTAIVILASVLLGVVMLWWEDELFLSDLGLHCCLGRANVMLEHAEQEPSALSTAFIPLRHLWYISALVQIYLIWTVGNQILQRQPRARVIGILSALAVVSLAYCYSFSFHEWLAKGGVRLWEQSAAPSPYAVLPRLWEVLAGCTVTLLPSLRERRAWAVCAAVAGLALLFGSIGIGCIPGAGSGEISSPYTLPAVVGTMLVIRYLPGAGMSGLLTRRPLKWLGGVSFSLFLVGMPVVAFGYLWTYGEPGVLAQAAMLAVALGLAWGLRKGVDKRELLPEVVLGLWAGAFLLCGAGTLTDGFRNFVDSVTINIPASDWKLCRDDRLRVGWPPALNFSGDVFKYLNANPPKNKERLAPLLTLGDMNRRASVALIGDSHAAHLYAGLNQFCELEEIGGVYVSSVFLPFHNWPIRQNTAKEHALLEWLRLHPELTHIIIGQRWASKLRHVRALSGQAWATASRFEADLRAFLQELQALNKQVILVAPTPEFEMRPLQHYCKVLNLRGRMITHIAPVCTLEQHMQNNSAVLPILRKLEKEGLCSLLDPVEALGDRTEFLAAADNTLLMYDEHHMYAEHSIYLIERLIPQLRQMLGIISDKPIIPTRMTTERRSKM